jgi:AraC-like DNA-binding protein
MGKSSLALVRATHMIDYISALRDIGAPVDRRLSQSKLPECIEETPDLYVSVPIALEWIARTGHDLEPMELGLLGARKACLSRLRPAHQVAIATAQTGLKRLEALAALSRHEDSALEVRVRVERDGVRVICNMTGLERHAFVCFAEWLNLQGILAVMHSVAGPSWSPREMCFMSSNRVPDAVRSAFPDTRILVGQPQTSVTVGLGDLALPTNDAIEMSATPKDSSGPTDPDAQVWEFASLLRMLVQPYLRDGRTDLAFVAELAGVSTRTLQRRLETCGTTYSRVLSEARFGLARAHLKDPALKVIDVAMMAGYESPQHFTRAFRNFTGVTPKAYRRRSRQETSATGRPGTD